MSSDQSFNKPLERVPLTEAQIEAILSEVPFPPGAGKSAVRIAREENIRQLRDYLEEQITLPPVEEAFLKFKEAVIEAIYLSFVEVGTPVGVLSGTALSGPLTQMTLNTFHFAGQQSGVAAAFNQVRDFLTGSKINRNPSMKIFLKDPNSGTDLHDVFHVGTSESIYAMRPELEETTVETLVITPNVLNNQEALQEGVFEIMRLAARLRPERFQGAESRFPLTYVLRLELDTYRMWTHRITMQDVALGIEGTFPPNSLTCIWRSQLEGIMYVLVDELRDYGMRTVTPQNAVLMFINQGVIPKMKEWNVKGIPGVVAIEPREVHVMDVIDRVQFILTESGKSVRMNPSRFRPNPEPGGVQVIMISEKKTRMDGPSLYDVYKLLSLTGFSILSVDKTNLEIRVQHDGNILVDLASRIEEARKVGNKAILEAASFSYIVTNGTNFEAIVWRDDIDLCRSCPMNSHEVAAILGNDAARLFLIEEFRKTLENFSSYINLRHIDVMFDLLTNLGLVNSLTYAGVNRRALGPLTAASHQRSMDVFANSSILGDNQKILGVSPSMYVGQQSSQIGTGAFGTVEDNTYIPTDPVGMPISDQMIEGDVLIDEIQAVFENSGFANLLEENEIGLEKSALGAIDKSFIMRTASITNESPSLNLIVPGGATGKTSETLVRALAKVTAGSNVEFVEPAGPSSVPVEKVRPTVPVEDLDLDTLELVQTQIVPQVVISQPVLENLPVPVGVQALEVPKSIPRFVAPSQKGINAVSSSGPKARILNVELPRPIPAPILPIPPVPRSQNEIVRLPVMKPVNPPTVPNVTNSGFDVKAFLGQLPTIDSIKIPTETQVQMINYGPIAQALILVRTRST